MTNHYPAYESRRHRPADYKRLERRQLTQRANRHSNDDSGRRLEESGDLTAADALLARQGEKKVLDEGNDAVGFGRKAQEPGRLLRGFHLKDMLDDSGGFVKPIAKNSDVSHTLITFK